MRVAMAVACALVAGCSASKGTTLGGDDGPSGGGASGPAGGGGETGLGGLDASGGSGGGGADDVIAEIYGHSASVLYKLDPLTLEVAVIGPFNGCSSVIDIAIDKTHTLVGTSSFGVHAIDKYTASCTLISSGSYPNSLSYVPEGTLEPSAEVLVGFLGGDYVRISPQSGQVTTIGQIGAGYASSGDIVSVKGGSSWLTVKGASCNDCLIEVDPKSGKLVKDWGPLGYPDVFGLAFWGGKAYGFSNGGDLFEIDFSGGTLATKPIPVPNAPPDLSFWGAGSSTVAPVVAPK